VSLEGEERERFKKRRNDQVKEIDDIQRGRLWGFIFLHNTKFSSFEGTK